MNTVSQSQYVVYPESGEQSIVGAATDTPYFPRHQNGILIDSGFHIIDREADDNRTEHWGFWSLWIASSLSLLHGKHHRMFLET